MVTIFFASGASRVASPDIINFDKAGHAAVFGLLATLIARTQPLSRWWVGVLGAALYGLADEFRQSFTPGRSVEVADWCADAAGAVLAGGAYRFWAAYRRLLEAPVFRKRQPQVASGEAAVTDRAA